MLRAKAILSKDEVNKYEIEAARSGSLIDELQAKLSRLTEKDREFAARYRRQEAVSNAARKEFETLTEMATPSRQLEAKSNAQKAENKLRNIYGDLEKLRGQTREVREGIEKAERAKKEANEILEKHRTALADWKVRETRLLNIRLEDLNDRQAKIRDELRASKERRAFLKEQKEKAQQESDEHAANAAAINARIGSGQATMADRDSYVMEKRKVDAANKRVAEAESQIQEEKKNAAGPVERISKLVKAADEVREELGKVEAE